VFDLKLPVFALIGIRNGLVDASLDSAKAFAEPILRAWGIANVVIASEQEKNRLADHYRACQQAGQAGVVLFAEGPP
jgi:hypothetical protein